MKKATKENATKPADLIADLERTIAEQQVKLAEITQLAQQTRADFENYRKHTDQDIDRARLQAEKSTIAKMLEVIDIIDLATAHVPDELSDNDWVQGIAGIQDKLAKLMDVWQLKPIECIPGDVFDHNIHEALQVDDQGGDTEIISNVLRVGYMYKGQLLRPTLVQVVKKSDGQ